MKKTRFRTSERTSKIEETILEVSRLLGDDPRLAKHLEPFETWRTGDYAQAPLLRLGVVGMYSAGKSTLLSALTGEHIATGAGVTTEYCQEFLWKGISFFDSPGYRAGQEAHDQRTEDLIDKTDLLLFTVSNELLHEEAHRFFHWCANDRRRASDMLLVVTKMSRETGERAHLEQHLRRMVAPYPLDQFQPNFIDALDYRTAIEENDDELLRLSGVDDFVRTLDQAITERGKDSRFRTSIRKCLETLEEAHASLESWLLSAEKEANGINESVRHIRNCRSEVDRRIQEEFRIFRSKAREWANELCAEVGVATQETLASKATECQQKLEQEAETLSQSVGNIVEEEYERLREALAKVSLGPEHLDFRMRSGSGAFQANAPGRFDGSKTKTASEAASKAGTYLSDLGKDQVYAAAKWVGIKFKPWGATKLTAAVNGAGKCLGAVGTGLGVYIQYKEDQEQARIDEEVRKARKEIREDFIDRANEICGLLDEKRTGLDLKHLSPLEEETKEALAAARKQARRTEDLEKRIQAAKEAADSLYASVVTVA